MDNAVVIVGAGPYGLSLAKKLTQQGIQPVLYGVPLETWKRMPEGLMLRSKITPAFNPFGDRSFEEYLRESNIEVTDNPPPISRTLFLEYTEWFLERERLTIIPRRITQIGAQDGQFLLTDNEGTEVQATCVVVANGINDYSYVPESLSQTIPPALWSHTSDVHDLRHLHSKRVLVIGGRQAGLEWSALLCEAGAQVEAAYRHETPLFQTPNWEILKKIVAETMKDPAWFKTLPEKERDDIVAYIRPAARRQVEPWLEPRIVRSGIVLHPNVEITKLELQNGKVVATIAADKKESTLVPFDFVVFATGFRPDLARMSMLDPELQSRIEISEGYPVLNERFESSIPKLYFTGLIAEKEFGPLMGFMTMCEASATILSGAICSELMK